MTSASTSPATMLDRSERGVGEPLVFVHGSASDRRTWAQQLDAFAERFRVIAYSRRYHWPNEPIAPGADYAMQEQLDDLRALLHALGATPAHLVGHSYGAYVCLLLAMQDPAMVRSLVLIEPPVLRLFVDLPPKPGQIFRLLATRPRTAVAIMKFGATGFAPAARAARRGDLRGAMRIFGRAVLGPDAYRRLSPARLEQVHANAIAAEFLGSGLAALDVERLRDIRVPILLIAGRNSPRLFPRLIDRLEELLPNAERVTIPGASHIAHEDNAREVNAAIMAFLDRSRRR